MLSAYFNTGIVIKPYQGKSGKGTAVYGETITSPGRIVSKKQRFISADGVELVSTAELWLPPNCLPPIDSLITADGQIYTLKAIRPAKGFQSTIYNRGWLT